MNATACGDDMVLTYDPSSFLLLFPFDIHNPLRIDGVLQLGKDILGTSGLSVPKTLGLLQGQGCARAQLGVRLSAFWALKMCQRRMICMINSVLNYATDLSKRPNMPLHRHCNTVLQERRARVGSL